MINYLLLGCSVVLAVVKSAFVKQYSSHAPDKNSPIFFFNLVAYGLASIIQLVVNGLPSLSLWIVLPAAGYALSCYLMQIFLKRLEHTELMKDMINLIGLLRIRIH